jgi:hypothetical protein
MKTQVSKIGFFGWQALNCPRKLTHCVSLNGDCYCKWLSRDGVMVENSATEPSYFINCLTEEEFKNARQNRRNRLTS